MASFDTAGAYINLFYLTLIKRSDLLQVGIETAFVDVVGMADIVSNHWFFPAYFTFFGHAYFSLIFIRKSWQTKRDSQSSLWTGRVQNTVCPWQLYEKAGTGYPLRVSTGTWILILFFIFVVADSPLLPVIETNSLQF